MPTNNPCIIRLAYALIGAAVTPLLVGSPCPPAASVRLSISPVYTFGGSSVSSAIYPDSSLDYVDGVGGVSAIINGCTNDVVITLAKANRTVGFDFRNAVATNSGTPSWTAVPFATKAHITVSNILYGYNPAAYYQFTTVVAYSVPAPDNMTYQLQFVNPNAQAAMVRSGGVNQPYLTSLVVVTHTPANPSTGSVETWVIAPDNTNVNPGGTPSATQVGGLITPRGGNAGQFSLPFQFTVMRK